MPHACQEKEAEAREISARQDRIICKILPVIQVQTIFDVPVKAEHHEQDQHEDNDCLHRAPDGAPPDDKRDHSSDTAEEKKHPVIITVHYAGGPPHDKTARVQSLPDRRADDRRDAHDKEKAAQHLTPHMSVQIRVNEDLEHAVHEKTGPDRVGGASRYSFLLLNICQ